MTAVDLGTFRRVSRVADRALPLSLAVPLVSGREPGYRPGPRFYVPPVYRNAAEMELFLTETGRMRDGLGPQLVGPTLEEWRAGARPLTLDASLPPVCRQDGCAGDVVPGKGRYGGWCSSHKADEVARWRAQVAEARRLRLVVGL